MHEARHRDRHRIPNTQGEYQFSGRAAVWIRRVPPVLESARWASLIEGERRIKDDEDFWGLYRGLLGLIAGARDEKGEPNFEQNKLTRI
jgi:hypothetical protein